MTNKILKCFDKQPAEALYFKVHFTDWLADQADAYQSVAVDADDGITLSVPSVVNGVVKILYSGGTHGVSYKVTITMTTTGGQIKQAEVVIRVREV